MKGFTIILVTFVLLSSIILLQNSSPMTVRLLFWKTTVAQYTALLTAYVTGLLSLAIVWLRVRFVGKANHRV